MDGILQYHKNYLFSSIEDMEPNFVLDRVMGQKSNAASVIQGSHQGLLSWDWTEWPSTTIRFSSTD